MTGRPDVAAVDSNVWLKFSEASRSSQTHVNLSAVREDGRCLWVAGDETATVERLRAHHAGKLARYDDEHSYALADFVDLPGDSGDEADVEGLARAGNYLWAVGSHSLKRSKIKPEHADAKSMKRLAKIEDQINRRLIIRVPVVDGADGSPELRREATVDGEKLTAAVLGSRGKSLTDHLAEDKHLGPFLSIPSKDNGFDLEGVAVHDDSLYLGLRGPVLRGWAVLVEVVPTVKKKHPQRLRLSKIGKNGRRYRKHFLDLDGLGIRDLCPDGDDLLVLAGPSMDLDGPVRVYRWHQAGRTEAPEVVRGEEITPILELPYGDGDDHAEGLALVTRKGKQQLLVVYDSPAEHRLTERGIAADLVELP